MALWTSAWSPIGAATQYAKACLCCNLEPTKHSPTSKRRRQAPANCPPARCKLPACHSVHRHLFDATQCQPHCADCMMLPTRGAVQRMTPCHTPSHSTNKHWCSTPALTAWHQPTRGSLAALNHAPTAAVGAASTAAAAAAAAGSSNSGQASCHWRTMLSLSTLGRASTKGAANLLLLRCLHQRA